MGAPELPGDPGEEDLRVTQPNIQHAPLPSDESDNEAIDVYDGYQPLAMGDDAMDTGGDDNSLMDESSDETLGAESIELGGGADTNLPLVESADVEIERQVWSEPRPKELQLELDNTRTTEILNAMASFTLPNAVVPEWAAGVPEESWKQELLLRIRQRREASAAQHQPEIDKVKPTSF